MRRQPALDLAHGGQAVEGRAGLGGQPVAQLRDASPALAERGGGPGRVALLLLDASLEAVEPVEPGLPPAALRDLERPPGRLSGLAQPAAGELRARQRLGRADAQERVA